MQQLTNYLFTIIMLCFVGSLAAQDLESTYNSTKERLQKELQEIEAKDLDEYLKNITDTYANANDYKNKSTT